MTKPITCRDTAWTSLILLCGKCARKSDGGFGDKGEDSLKTTLRRALAVRPRATRPHIIETRCMGLCPKNAVAALNPHHPGTLRAIPRGTPPDEVVALLAPMP